MGHIFWTFLFYGLNKSQTINSWLLYIYISFFLEGSYLSNKIVQQSSIQFYLNLKSIHIELPASMDPQTSGKTK